MKKRIALIFGGNSAEHEVSLRSAKNIYLAMNPDKYDVLLIGISKEGTWYQFDDESVFKYHQSIKDSVFFENGNRVTIVSEKGKPYVYSLRDNSKSELDLAFPIIHGTMGEDGTIQGLFKMMKLPFVGCGVWSSAAGMDKEIMKRLLSYANIPSARYVLITPENIPSYNELVDKLGTPFFIKPANAGSSVGVHKIKSAQDYSEKVKDSLQFDFKVLAEEFIRGRELECSVMGLNSNPKASLPGEVVVQAEFYSYEAKYIDENGALIEIPAKLNDDTVQALQKMAEKTFQVMGCDGLTRVDFFLTEDNRLYINEINTLPGFTQISMYPKMWEASGLSYQELVSELIELGFRKFEQDSTLKTSYL